MAYRTKFTKTDLAAAFVCIVFLCFCLGAVGSRGNQQMQSTMCLANLHQFSTVIEHYKQDHSGIYPYSTTYKASSMKFQDFFSEVTWWHYLGPYLKDRRVAACPRNPTWMFGYSYNVNFGYLESDPCHPAPPSSLNPTVKDSDVQNPSTKICMTDSSMAYYNGVYIFRDSTQTAQYFAYRFWPAGTQQILRVNYAFKDAAVHRTGVNNLYADGHADWKYLGDEMAPLQWWPVESRMTQNGTNPWGLHTLRPSSAPPIWP